MLPDGNFLAVRQGWHKVSSNAAGQYRGKPSSRRTQRRLQELLCRLFMPQMAVKCPLLKARLHSHSLAGTHRKGHLMHGWWCWPLSCSSAGQIRPRQEQDELPYPHLAWDCLGEAPHSCIPHSLLVSQLNVEGL